MPVMSIVTTVPSVTALASLTALTTLTAFALAVVRQAAWIQEGRHGYELTDVAGVTAVAT